METEMKPHVVLTDKFFRAMAYAAKWHQEQVRKSTNIAYISHPFGVAALVLESLGDEDQAIGGLLHDVAEDCGGEPRLVEIEELFGGRVAKIVAGCSDSLVAVGAVKAAWHDRKKAHIDHMKHASIDMLIVAAADKAHNGRAIASDLQAHGTVVWSRFNAGGVDCVWYYRSMLEVFEEREVSQALLNPLRNAIAIMENYL